jgi:hypothetical protein
MHRARLQGSRGAEVFSCNGVFPLRPQSLVDEAGLGGGRYLFGAEFARALREAAKQLLRGRKLPALLEAEDGELWLTWVDAMIGGSGVLWAIAR